MSSQVLQALTVHARERAAHPALETFSQQWTYADLQQQCSRLSLWLRQQGCQRIALLMDNSPLIVLADLAVLDAGAVCVPLPLFFSPAQMQHTLRQAAIDTVLTDREEVLLPAQVVMTQSFMVGGTSEANGDGERIQAHRLAVSERSPLPSACNKITFTSGSTGDPKGVCLGQAQMESVARSLCLAAEASANERHLSLLPFATLLENIGGVYTTILNGSTLIIPPLAECGLQGSSSLDVRRLLQALHQARASSCIMIPQMLQAILAAIRHGAPRPTELRYVAVGGAPVAPALLAQAEEVGLPVYEGYGLSEAASVVAVNTPGANRHGSVGKPLPHTRLRLAEDGEIWLQGNVFFGYLGEPPRDPGDWLATGDVGYLDAEGFLHLEGRKKHMFISSFGRNISPEWVERELTLEAAIAQACVFGEARPYVVAVLVPRGDPQAVAAAVLQANQRLPDYAQVKRWIIADEPFSLDNGQWTGTSRPRRQVIWQVYDERLAALYDKGGGSNPRGA